MANYASFRDVIQHTVEQRRDFFRLIFGSNEGYVCLGYKDHTRKSMDEDYYLYPQELDKMCADVDNKCQNLVHAYFCPNLLDEPKRSHENVILCPTAWADLDTCNPVLMQVTPSIVVQTSKNKWQAFWRFESPQSPDVAEDISRRVAYFHAEQGADKGCWNRTRLLRIPYTPNYKYGDIQTAPVVVVLTTTPALYRVSDFNKYPELEAFKFAGKPMPEMEFIPDESADELFARFSTKISNDTIGLHKNIPGPDQDWSTLLWRLEKACVEAGMSPEETFQIASTAGCNKYKRDRRPDGELWIEVKKAFIRDIELHNLAPTATSTIPDLLTDQEIRLAQSKITFVEKYIKYASELTDAPMQFHEAGAFTILSSIMSSHYRLPTSFGVVKPNMWFMILANSTFARKTTSLNLAVRLLLEVDSEAVMATDGSPEGILTALTHRPGRASIYLRDEFTGLLDTMINKDYMSSMAETFTKLYDGDNIRRVLRKEEVKVERPIFIMFTSGVKTKTQLMLTEESISSGFIPRFVVITAEPDFARTRPVGPPIVENHETKEVLLNELHVLYGHYNNARLVQGIGTVPPSFDASLTPQAWARYNKFESTMVQIAIDGKAEHLTPVYDRLAKSTLKAAMLLAGSRKLDGDVVIDEEDIIHAIYYCKSWFKYTSELVNCVGKTNDERLIDAILDKVSETGDLGVARSDIMQFFKIDSRRAELIFTTMEMRGLVRKVKWRAEYRYHEVV